MTIKVKIPRHDLTSSKSRFDMARYVSGAICAGQANPDHIPYKPMEHDDSFWTVDEGNDWKVRFFHDEPDTFAIVHRYDNQQAIAALAGWLAYRLDGIIVPE